MKLQIKFYVFLVALFIGQSAIANSLKGRISDENNAPFAGASVYWKGTTIGDLSNDKGTYVLPRTSLTDTLIVSAMGYETVYAVIPTSQQVFDASLQPTAIALDEVVKSHTRQSTFTSRIEPLQTQRITADELCRAACCNLAESFETNASVDVSYSDAATGARQIRLLGLSGTYVQMLTEQVPNLSGAASLYGLGYVPGPWMESIQVSKGASSVKNGFESVTGQINVEYKKPQTSDPLTINLFGANTGRMEVNADGNIIISPNLSTGILAHYSNEKMEHDANKDGFMDLPAVEQLNLMNRWYYKTSKYIAQLGVNVIAEERNSGQMSNIGQDRYQVGISTRRGSFFTKHGYIFNEATNTSTALVLGGSLHRQKSQFGKRQYDIFHDNFNANWMFETHFTERHSLSAGLSLAYDRYNESLDKSPLLRTYIVPGVYAQYTFNLDDKLNVLVGLRGDNHNQYGAFATPRLHLKYAPFEWLTLRASAGKGYRVANELIEYSYLLASNRKMEVASNLNRLEEAWNYGLSASANWEIAGKPLSLTAEWYYTNFAHQVVADMESPHKVSFYNLDGRSFAQNGQIEASYPFFEGFSLTAAYRITHAMTTYNGILKERPLTNRYKALATASYATKLKKWQFDLTTSFNGSGRMPSPDVNNPLWEDEFPAYFLLNAQVTKNFKNWSIYLGGENLTNYTQQNPIIDASMPMGDNFDASMIYAPLHGAKLYLGVRWNLQRN